MANPILESYVSSFDEISALQRKPESSGLVEFKELSRDREEIAEEKLRKARAKSLQYET